MNAATKPYDNTTVLVSVATVIIAGLTQRFPWCIRPEWEAASLDRIKMPDASCLPEWALHHECLARNRRFDATKLDADSAHVLNV